MDKKKPVKESENELNKMELEQSGSTIKALIGFLIFGLGITAFIAVLYIGWTHYWPRSDNQIQIVEAEPSIAITSVRPEPAPPARELPPPADLPDPDSLIIPDTLVPLNGTWFAHIGGQDTFFQVNGTVFQVIRAENFADSRIRRYARGVVEYNPQDGLLVMRPSREMGPPPPEPNVFYRILTMRDFGIIPYLDPQNDELYWVHPVKTDAFRSRHPIFFSANSDVVKWARVEQ